MRRYNAVLFDLCGTVLQYRIDRMPMIEINGEQVQTTTPLLYACFQEFDRGETSYEKFHADFITISEEIVAEKIASGKEILSFERFGRFLDRLGADLGKRLPAIHRLLMDIHLERVARCLELLPNHRALLLAWKEAYPLGLITIFDDRKTVRQVLARDQIAHLFETTQISAELGIRKPQQEIFQAAFDAMQCTPAETLFVGDNWTEDILGAKAAGMETAWINTERLPQPQGAVRSDYDLSDLEELQRIL